MNCFGSNASVAQDAVSYLHELNRITPNILWHTMRPNT